MGRKIFISYKYWDDDVYPVPRFSDYHPKVRDYVSWLENKFQNRTEHYYKGESDNEDLSMYFFSSLISTIIISIKINMFIHITFTIFRCIIHNKLVFN